jgi:hypothetical protein
MNKLLELGLTDEQVTKLDAEGVKTADDMTLLSGDDIRTLTGCGLVTARRVAQAFAPLPVPMATLASAAPAGSTSGGDEIPEGGAPTTAQVNSYAGQLGIDAGTLNMLMFANMGAGAGLDMDLSGLLPIPQIVGGYNPKLRNMPYMIMGQIERRLGSPIVVINTDGSVNPEHTVRHIMNLEEGFDAPEDNIYYDADGTPFEIIAVGVDAQGIYDADPIQPTRALQVNGMGFGRINWHATPLDVRQVVYFAANTTGELNQSDEAMLGRLRDKIGPTTNRLTLRTDFPKAIAAYNEALRTGSLPTLRVQLSRQPRRREVMPRRRTMSTNDRRDLSELGREEGAPSGGGFRDDHDYPGRFTR